VRDVIVSWKHREEQMYRIGLISFALAALVVAALPVGAGAQQAGAGLSQGRNIELVAARPRARIGGYGQGAGIYTRGYFPGSAYSGRACGTSGDLNDPVWTCW
jgi:hypothetical protein